MLYEIFVCTFSCNTWMHQSCVPNFWGFEPLIAGPEWVCCHPKDQGNYARRSKEIRKGRSTGSSRLLYAVTWPFPIPTLPCEIALCSHWNWHGISLGLTFLSSLAAEDLHSSVMRAMCECCQDYGLTVTLRHNFIVMWFCVRWSDDGTTGPKQTFEELVNQPSIQLLSESKL